MLRKGSDYRLPLQQEAANGQQRDEIPPVGIMKATHNLVSFTNHAQSDEDNSANPN